MNHCSKIVLSHKQVDLKNGLIILVPILRYLFVALEDCFSETEL